MSVETTTYFGRRQILSSETEVTKENISKVISRAITIHEANSIDIKYLYNYYKGKQPILGRTKEIRSEICNKIVENRANEIVSFKVGFYVGEPIQYISRSASAETSEKLNFVNDFMVEANKETCDKELAEWMCIGGTGYRMVLPNKNDDVNSPFEIFTLNPEDSFVVYSTEIGHKKLCGGCCIRDEDNKIIRVAVYTPTEYFVLDGLAYSIIESRPHFLGAIPIIEYPLNNARLGVFEPVIPLLNAINEIDSNRLDGIEQFIQSLLVVYNATFEEGTTSSTIRESGMVILHNVGDQKADIKEIAEQLDQTQTQTLKNDLYNTILRIVGMPSQGDGNTSDSSNNGAMILKNGWQGAEARAKDFELIFKKSEREMLRLVLKICKDLANIDLKNSDIDIKFTRRQYEDLMAKSQVLTTMLSNDKIAPELAFTTCGLFSDPQDAYQLSKNYYEANKAKAEEENKEEIEEEQVITDEVTAD